MPRRLAAVVSQRPGLRLDLLGGEYAVQKGKRRVAAEVRRA